MSHAAIALTRLGGVASFAELRAEVGRRRVRSALASGLIVRTAPHTYALPGADRDRVAAVELGGAVGLVTAALAYGWKVKQIPDRPTVYVRPNRNVSPIMRKGVDLRWADLSSSEIDRRITDPARTVIDCARFLAFDEALSVADSALRAGDVEHGELIFAAERSPRTGRTRARRVAEAASPLAANPMESVLRAICLEIKGLDPQPQIWVGDVGRADLVDPRRHLVIEAESMEHHGSLQGYRKDVRRYTAFVRLGYVVLRFCWEDIMFRPDYVRDTVQQVMGDSSQRPWQRDVGRLAA